MKNAYSIYKICVANCKELRKIENLVNAIDFGEANIHHIPSEIE